MATKHSLVKQAVAAYLGIYLGATLAQRLLVNKVEECLPPEQERAQAVAFIHGSSTRQAAAAIRQLKSGVKSAEKYLAAAELAHAIREFTGLPKLRRYLLRLWYNSIR